MHRAPWVTGMLLNLIGSTTINFGTNLIKYSHILNESKGADTALQKRRPIWFAGMLLFVLGNGINFLSFAYAAQSLLAAIGSIQFISNVVFATCLLEEKLTRRIVEGTSAIVVGNTFVLIFASHESKSYSVDELQVMFINPAFLAYLAFIFTSVVGLNMIYTKAKKRVKDQLPSKQSSIIIPICYAATSGMIGSLSVLLAKATSQLFRTTVSGDNQFKYGFAYYMLIGWVGLTIYWLNRLNNGLRKFPSMVIIPSLQVFWTIFSIVGGGVFFDEFGDFSMSQSVGFLAGVMTILAGVLHLSSNHEESTSPQEIIENLKMENEIIVQVMNENCAQSPQSAWDSDQSP
eukprot:TRINITY_DN15947_c0_g1_i1.p1 TRINITY_DN15947_c0_g1~~TRINITY_DN15947_c0_g1_i1.p1  ORF type:complete len:346 (+),score=61.94 TRINITY_DN15947_c0_g1_i1:45-1082(+)